MNVKNKKKMSALSLAMAGVMSIAGVSAYFTDADTATNTFTVGRISLDLQEPSWDPPTDITPNEEFAKDPQIKNDGINKEYVFMEVVVPYANVVTANADGSRNEATDTELFNYVVKEGWVELGTGTKDEDAKTITHLYAYAVDGSMTELNAGETTSTLFDYIKFANVIEDEGLEESVQNVIINAYGIQTNHITDTDLNGVDDGTVSPEAVWEVLSTQNFSTIKDEESQGPIVIAWDGDTSSVDTSVIFMDETSYDGAYDKNGLYYVSDRIPTNEDIMQSSMVVISSDGFNTYEEESLITEYMVDTSVEGLTKIFHPDRGMFFIVHKENTVDEGNVFPKTGVYFQKQEMWDAKNKPTFHYVSELKLPVLSS